MECLTPPVEFVPMDEWYCPACASWVDADEDDLERAATDLPASNEECKDPANIEEMKTEKLIEENQLTKTV